LDKNLKIGDFRKSLKIDFQVLEKFYFLNSNVLANFFLAKQKQLFRFLDFDREFWIYHFGQKTVFLIFSTGKIS
jgi:hypothetical protein